jgi:hypothetical protein
VCVHLDPVTLALDVKGASMLRSLKRSGLRAAALAMTLAAAGCVVYDDPRPAYPSGPAYPVDRGRPVYQGEGVHIPPGHLPPPGLCRIWFPDRPPGHQPAPGRCDRLRHQVPPGAILVYG